MKSMQKTTYAFCENGILERPRYFPGQLMTPDELTLEQDYFRDMARRHNRLLHGWGVVCGALVCPAPPQNGNGKSHKNCNETKDGDINTFDPWHVRITSGYILGPYGDEIIIEHEHIFDVRTQCVTGVSGDPCLPAPDPWCSEMLVERQPGPVYVAVRYKEVQTRPVRIHPVGCSCDDSACEYSRLRDCYEICVLDECPESHQGDPPGLPDCYQWPMVECPPCPEDPWVILARVNLGVGGIDTDTIDNYSCRRMVISFAELWCRPGDKSSQSSIADEYVSEIKHLQSELNNYKEWTVSMEEDNKNIYEQLKECEKYVSEIERLKSELKNCEKSKYSNKVIFEEEKKKLTEQLEEFNDKLIQTQTSLQESQADEQLMLAQNREEHARRLLSSFMNIDELLLDEEQLVHIQEMKATKIGIISSKTNLGKELDNQKFTVGKVASTDFDTFLGTATQHVEPEKMETMEAQAKEVWERSKVIIDTVQWLRTYP